MYNGVMNRRILIVDDTKSWLDFHERLIKELYGNIFEITLSDCAKNALDVIRKNTDNPFSLIITDLQMERAYEPKLAGEWLIEQIKSISQYSASKIVIISAMYNIEYSAKRLNTEYISKTRLINNKLLMKYMLEKLMPFLTYKIDF